MPDTAAFPKNQRAFDLLREHVDKLPTPRGEPKPGDHDIRRGLDYLDAFGYLKNELAEWKDINLGDIVDAVKQFQDMFHLRRDGNFSHQVSQAMLLPRCGFPDVERDHHRRAGRVRDWLASKLPAWQKRGLYYGVAAYVNGIDHGTQDQIIQAAFDDWTRLGDITVQKTSNNQADIVISTGQGQKDNFDGPSGVLAWAYLPDGGDQQLQMKFDLDETWTTDPGRQGILMKNVATHEFGHLLGLSHSNVQSALMAPYYAVGVTSPQQNDDIPRFQARYGTTPAKPPDPAPGGGTPPPGQNVRQLVIALAPGSVVTLDGRRIV